MISSALTPMNPSEALFSTTFNDGAVQGYAAFSRSNNPRITLTNGEIYINGTHGNNTASVRMLNGALVRAELVGIEIRDFSILDVDSIRFSGRNGNDKFTNSTTIPGKLYGGDGNDTISGGGGNDLIWGGTGRDVISGQGGHDSIWGGPGNDVLSGQAGGDNIYGEAGIDNLSGGWGADMLTGGNGNDIVQGNEGNDFVTGDAGDDLVLGGSGDDNVHGWEGNDDLRGDIGNDVLYGGLGSDVMRGGTGADRLYGGEQDDEIYGNAGDDKIYGGRGNDFLSGEVGNDLVNGQVGDDVMRGGSGNDLMLGGPGFDTLDGSVGKDDLRGGANRDVLIGGNDSAQDRLIGEGGADYVLYFAGDIVASDSLDLKVVMKNKTSQWTTGEMLVIADGLKALYSATYNNRLVDDRIVGKDLRLEKYNSLQGGAAAQNYMSINTVNGVTTYDRAIRFSNWDESNELINDTRVLAFVHEVAHNFDNQFEYTATPGISWGTHLNFRAISSWTQDPPNTSQYTRSGDGQWWYLSTAQFYRSYSTINPGEDWATVWELYFNPAAVPPTPGTNLAQKLQLVQNFFNYLK